MINENSDQREVSLKEWINSILTWTRFLISKWVYIIIFGISGAVIGLYYSISAKPKFTGEVIFVLSSEQQTSNFVGLASQFGLNLGNTSNSGIFDEENIIGLLKSRKIITGALFKKLPNSQETLLNHVGNSLGFFENWKKNDRTQNLIPFPENKQALLPLQDSLVDVIHKALVQKYIEISKPDKKLTFYSLTTTSRDETISVYLTKNVVDEAAKMYIDTKTKAAKSNLSMLQSEADSLRILLGGSINSAASAVDQTFNLNPAFQSQRTGVQRSQMQMQAMAAAYTEVIRNLEIAKVALQKETPLYEIIDEPRFPLVSIKPGKLKCLVVGGFLMGSLCCGFFLLKRSYQLIMGS